MSDNTKTDKAQLAKDFSEPIELVHLKEYEEEFCKVFEGVMAHLLQ